MWLDMLTFGIYGILSAGKGDMHRTENDLSHSEATKVDHYFLILSYCYNVGSKEKPLTG